MLNPEFITVFDHLCNRFRLKPLRVLNVAHFTLIQPQRAGHFDLDILRVKHTTGLGNSRVDEKQTLEMLGS